MKHYVTLYIDPLFGEITRSVDIKNPSTYLNLDATHAFLGLTKDKSPDELDKIDNEIKMQKLNNADWKDIDKRWYESLETNEYNDGFWGFGTGTDSIYNTAGKVFQNNQYVMDNNVKTNTYEIKKLRSEQTFKNRCTLEISQEQYEKLLQEIKNDYEATKTITPKSEVGISGDLTYNVLNNNCVTWVLNKLDSIGIEIIDNEEWLPDNISTRDSLLQKFHYLQYLYAVFRKFQSIDSNLESIAGAKAFRTWARSMTQNKIFCALKIEGDITKGLNISTECKRTITQNQKYYENKLKDFITKSSDFMRVYNRINEQLERLLTKVKNLGYTNIQGDFTFIMWNDELQTRMLLDSKHRDENTKDYIAYPIEQIDPNIPDCNWTLNHNASFILILRDEMLCRAVYKNYHYSNMSESFIDSTNKSHIAILSGNDDLSYWSKSLHALRKSVVCEE